MGLKRLLIIHPEGNAVNNPTVKCLIDLFVDSKFKVTYLTSENSKFAPILGVNFIKRSPTVEKLKRKLFNKYCLVKFSTIFSCLRNLHLFNKYDLILSIDREGLIEGAAISHFFQVPLIHVSFEIYFQSETFNKFKQIEIDASKQVSLWIIQDEIRASSLAEENRLSRSNGLVIPLASEGIGEISRERLRDDIGVRSDKKVAIFMGSLYKWTMFEELINQIDTIPDDWAIIIHERYGEAHRYIAENALESALKKGKVYISNFSAENVDRMGYVLSGVDVGLAFYSPTYDDPTNGLNLKYLGMASGKISTYLRYSVPIITNEIGLYADLSREFKFGLVIDDMKELSATLISFEKQQNLSLNAKKYFSNNLDFQLYKDSLIDEINKLTL